MDITLNGKTKSVPSAANVAELLTELELEPETVVIELNTVIVQPESYSELRLSEGDHVEIIRFVGGG